MAYYSSGYSDPNFGEYHQNLYSQTYDYDFSPSPPLADHNSSYEYGCYDFSGHDQAAPFFVYDPSVNHSNISYSAYTFSEPKNIEYDPALYTDCWGPAHTQFIISYSVSEFNVPEFVEYDPTPYGGGYDITKTYGQPLSPSEEICYPRSSVDLNANSLNGFSYGSIESPYGKEGPDKPAAKTQEGSKPTKADDQEKKVLGESKDENSHKPSESSQGKDSGEIHPDGYPSLPEYSSGYGNGSIGEHGGEYEKRVAQIPSGYGLETMDLCESLFGYWPCLARAKRREESCQAVCDGGSNDIQWKGTADYLFGASDPYGERWDIGGTYQHSMYAYKRHYQEHHVYRQAENDQDSWLQ